MGNARDVSGSIRIALAPGMFDPLDKLRLKTSVGRGRLRAWLCCLAVKVSIRFGLDGFPACSVGLALEETAMRVEIVQPWNRRRKSRGFERGGGYSSSFLDSRRNPVVPIACR